MRGIAAFVAACIFAFSAPASAQQPKPLFASSDPIRITIQAPLSGVIRSRSSSPVQGTLTDPGGQQLPVAISARGITRRSADVCEFPPLRVRFTSPPPATSMFAGQKSLKLVTHCRNSPSFQQYVLLEYSAYKMYNLLTPHSFRVRLANVDYRDSDGRPIVSRTGYFLENLGDVAARNGTRETHAPSVIPLSSLNPADAARYTLFQHMISNHDWSVRAGPAGSDCCHNAELIGPLSAGAIVIPYDFDFSGYVNAPYAVVPEQLKIGSVRQRVYRGYCLQNAETLAAARQMRELKPQMIAAITSTPGLDPAAQSRGIKFLEPFFADIASDEAVTANVLHRCVR